MHLTTRNVVMTVIIFLIFLTVIYQYRAFRIRQIENALYEHALVVAEPMWNFDTDQLENYLETVAQKYNYQSLEVLGEHGHLFYAAKKPKISSLERLLSLVGFIPEKKFEQKVIYREFDRSEPLGKIVVVWRDTSVYFISYALLVTLLLIVIVNLYSGILRSKKALEEKVKLVEEQLVELKRQKDYIEDIFNVVPEGLVTFDHNYGCLETNRSFQNIINNWATILQMDLSKTTERFLSDLRQQLSQANQGQYSMYIDSYTIHLEYSASEVPSYENIEKVVSIRDVTKIATMERQLAQAQKLEAVGRLAAGIAHEINTPTQYVSSNLDFLTESHREIAEYMTRIEHICSLEDKKQEVNSHNEMCDAFDDTDWEYLKEEIPKALEQSLEGMRRVTSIIVAMKNFSHPSSEHAELNDLNSAIESTSIVARNEWKYAAELDLHLDPSLPQVPCYLDQLNQVFLNIIVNSAHAIEEKSGGEKGEKGKIVIETSTADDSVIITIGDDGIGMSEEVRQKVFDPFFTTKELNKGTGQGLAIAYDVVVNRHKGSISVDSESGKGTTFTISLPLQKPA